MGARQGGRGKEEASGEKEGRESHLTVEEALNKGLFVIERFPQRPRDLENMQGALLVAHRQQLQRGVAPEF